MRLVTQAHQHSTFQKSKTRQQAPANENCVDIYFLWYLKYFVKLEFIIKYLETNY